MKLTPFYKLRQDQDNEGGVLRIHLWEDRTWDESGGHSVSMPMDTYEDIRKELNRLRRMTHLPRCQPISVENQNQAG